MTLPPGASPTRSDSPSLARLAPGLLALALAVVLGEPAHAAGCPDEVAVLITDAGFLPADVCVMSGGSVHWTNDSSSDQTVSHPAGTFGSGRIAPGGAFSITIEIAGQHAYRSNLDSSLQGRVIVAVSELGGALGAPASDNLPDLPFPQSSAEDRSLDPEVGVPTSRTRILVRFVDGTTVAQANDALAEADVALIGSLPPIQTLLVQVPPSDDHAAVHAARDVLRANPNVAVAFIPMVHVVHALPREASQDTLDELQNPPADPSDYKPQYLPVPSIDYDWDQVTTAAGLPDGRDGNRHLEAARVPHAWNWREWIERNGDPDAVVTGIYDAGFAEHEDLVAPSYDREPICRIVSGTQQCTDLAPDNHGTHVAGLIGAAFDNPADDGISSLGLNGVNPHARMRGIKFNYGGTEASTEDFIDILTRIFTGIDRIRVLNVSLGAATPEAADWWAMHPDPTCGPLDDDDGQPGSSSICRLDNEDGWLAKIQQGAAAIAPALEQAALNDVLVVKTTGNEGDDYCIDPPNTSPDCTHLVVQSETAGPVNYLARNWPFATPSPVLMVGSIGTDIELMEHSNRGADVTAITELYAQVAPPDDYYARNLGGTSFAAPQVAGLAGMMLAFDDSYDFDEIRERIIDWAIDDVPGGAPRMDAFAAMLSLDGAAKVLVDVNDLSKDGNRRLIRAAPTPLFPTGEAIGTDLHSSDEIDTTTGRLFKTSPDGFVDMRDFRRFRDAWLQVCIGTGECGGLVDSLDGEPNHPKRDLNFDGCAGETCEIETVFSRFDFNGDGRISRSDKALVPLDASGNPVADASDAEEMTDLEILASQWAPDPENDEGYEPFQLDQLMESSDLHIHADTVAEQGVTDLKIRFVADLTGDEYPERAIPPGETIVYTLPIFVPFRSVVTGTLGGMPVTEEGEVFTLEFPGDDPPYALCRRRLRLTADETTLFANGLHATQLRAKVETCPGDVEQPAVTFAVAPAGDYQLLPDETIADEEGVALGAFRAGFEVGSYEITATAFVVKETTELVTLTDTVTITTRDAPGVYYRWQQEVIEFTESGTSRWVYDGQEGDCDGFVRQRWSPQIGELGEVVWVEWRDGVQSGPTPPEEYRLSSHTGWERCVDEFTNVVPAPGSPNPVLTREGVLTQNAEGGVSVTERVDEARLTGVYRQRASDSRGPALADGGTLLDDYGGTWQASIPEVYRAQYTDHPLRGSIAITSDSEGIEVRNLGELGELVYEHHGQWAMSGTLGGEPIDAIHGRIDNVFVPREDDLDRFYLATGKPTAFTATMAGEYMFVSRADQSAMKYRTAGAEDVLRFTPDDEGGFEPYRYCEVVTNAYEREPRYTREDQLSNEGREGMWQRHETYRPVGEPLPSWAGEYPQPIGPVQFEFKYSFIAVPYESLAELESLVESGAFPQPDCSEDDALSPAFSSTPAEEGRNVHFTDLTTSPGNTIVSWGWDFGDGGTSTEQQPAHIFDDDGEYTVELSVIDSAGRIATTSQQIVVDNLSPSVEIDDAVALEGEAAQLVLRLADPGLADQADLHVRIESSNSDWPEVFVQYPAGVQVLLIPGLEPGVYPLTLTVTDKDDAIEQDTATLTVLGTGVAPPPPPPPLLPVATCDPGVVLDGEEAAFLDAINEYRLDSGAPPLVASPALTLAADVHSDDMAAGMFLEHIGSDGSNPIDRALDEGYPDDDVSENILQGLESGIDALAGWKSSPSHNANMLDPKWNAIGIARTESGVWYWSTSFGQVIDCPDSAFVAPPDAPLHLAANEDRDIAPRYAAEARVMAWYALELPEESRPQVYALFPTLQDADAQEADGDAAPPGASLQASQGATAVSDDYGPTTALWVSRVDVATGQIFQARNLSRDENGIPLPATIDFGNGRVVDLAPSEFVAHAYATEEVYAISLASTDSQAATTQVAVDVVATGPPVEDPSELPGGDVDPSIEPDFNLTLSPQSQVINPGSSFDFVATVTSVGGFDERVYLSVADLPPGVTASMPFGNSVVPTGLVWIRLTVDATAALTDFELDVTATAGDKVYTTSSFATLDFGLVPVCYGAATGTIRDRETNQPIPGAKAFSVAADDEGRYTLEQLSLGQNNEPKTISVTGSAPGYWSGFGTGLIECDRVSEIDILLVPGKTASLVGQVTIGQLDPDGPLGTVVSTGIPIPGARAERSSLHYDITDDDGNYLIENVPLNSQNAPTPFTITATAGGYWRRSVNGGTYEAGEVRRVDVALVPKCQTGFVRITLRFPDGTPAANERVQYRGFVWTTDSEGRIEHEPFDLAYNNQPVLAAIEAPGSRLRDANIIVDDRILFAECDADVDVEVLALPRIRNYAGVDLTIIDEETGLPVPDVTARVRVPGQGSEFSTSESDGIARYRDLLIGYGADDSLLGSVAVNDADWWDPPDVPVLLEANEIATARIEVLRRRTSSFRARAVDDVTGEGIEGARLRTYNVFTGEDGWVQVDDVNLGTRNTPVSLSALFEKEGYWSNFERFELSLGTVPEVEVRMLPVCEGAAIRGTVVNAVTREPLEDARVEVFGHGADLTDALGRYEHTDIQVGTDNSPRNVTVQASKVGFVTQRKTVSIFCNADLTVEFGRAESEFGAIEGTVTDDGGDPLAEVFIGSGFGASTTTDAAGDYLLTQVPLGDDGADREWSVTADPDDQDPQTASVVAKAGEVVRLDFVFGSNQAPIADAGSDQNTGPGMLVELDGSASYDPDGDTITYAWSFDSLPQDSALGAADITGADGPMPSFAPDVAGSYILRLVVSDDLVQGLPDTVSIEVVTPNVPPNADAGDDQSAFPGDLVLLDGTGSEDPDSGPQPLAYGWAFALQPAGSALTDADILGGESAAPSFTPDLAGGWEIELTVDDGADQDMDRVAIEVMVPNVPPNARAGVDQSREIGGLVELDGSGSDDPDAGPQPLAFAWRFVSLPAASLLSDTDIAGATTPTPSFLPDVAGVYVLALDVTDGEDGDTDNVMVEIAEPNVPPVADAGPDQEVDQGEFVVLDGSASSDPDAGPAPLSFSWRFLAVPMSSTVGDDDLTGAATDSPSFIASEPGMYTLELTVSDGEDSDTDEVDVEVFETVDPPDPPDPVLDLLARAKSGKVDVVWTPVERAVAYRVLRTDDPTLESEFELLDPMHESDYAVYVDRAVTNGITYFYVVIPIDAAGQEGPPSNVAEATPDARAR